MLLGMTTGITEHVYLSLICYVTIKYLVYILQETTSSLLFIYHSIYLSDFYFKEKRKVSSPRLLVNPKLNTPRGLDEN